MSPSKYGWEVKNHHQRSIREERGNNIRERKELQGNREYAVRKIQFQRNNNNVPKYEKRYCLEETRQDKINIKEKSRE